MKHVWHTKLVWLLVSVEVMEAPRHYGVHMDVTECFLVLWCISVCSGLYLVVWEHY